MIRGFLSFVMILCLALTKVPAGQVCAATAKTLNPSVDTVLTNVGNYILSLDTNPDYSSIWNVIGLVRSGRSVPQSYIDTFYNNTVNYLRDNNWQLSRTKYSDYSKLILGMTAIGKDASDIDGHNILEYLSDFSKVKLQGFNGPVWALIALKSHPDYRIPLDLGASEQTTEEGLIQYILGRETSKGGWTLYGDTPDTDITGMTIQALASYYGKRDDVTAAVDRALTWMSSAQNNEGGYSTLNGSTTSETSESDDQVIVALCSLGIDPGKDSRFIQPNGKWVISRLFEYYIPAGTNMGGFMHIFSGADDNGGGAAGTLNGMATEQGMYATAAYKRLLTGKTALYDMSDVTLTPGGEPSAPSSSGKDNSSTKDGSSSKAVKVTKLKLNHSKITLKKGKSQTLKVTVYPSKASNKKVKWISSNKKVATVTQKGLVKAIKAGTAKITVTAKDGSKKKAVCTVTVKKASSGSSKKSSSSSGNKGNQSSGSNQTSNSQSNSNRQTNSNNQTSNTQPVNRQTTGNTQQQTTQRVPVPTTGNSGSGNGSEEASTQTEAWTFDGEDFIPESAGDSFAEESTEGMDLEEYSTEEENGDNEDDKGVVDKKSTRVPVWLVVLMALLGAGAVTVAMKVPWMNLRDKLLLLILSRRKKK